MIEALRDIEHPEMPEPLLKAQEFVGVEKAVEEVVLLILEERRSVTRVIAVIRIIIFFPVYGGSHCSRMSQRELAPSTQMENDVREALIQ